MDVRMYVMTHKKIAPIASSIYHILHVGKKGKEDLGYPGDDTGDNISEKNTNYCELTGMYWLWKNCNCDIIGICHYRRFFCENERLLDKEYIEKTIEQYPIIVPGTTNVYNGTLKESYEFMHVGKDLELCHDVIKEKYPQYLEAYNYIINGYMFTLGNMWITKKDIFDKYCEWLFDILFEVEKRIDISGYDDYQRRVMGFLSERLFRVWLCTRPENICEQPVKMIETKDFNNSFKKLELKRKLVKLEMVFFISYWRTKKTDNGLIEPFACNDDFNGGKIPVWVTWWQGMNNTPEVVSMCIESLKRNLPYESVTIRIITLDNCMDYVTFTDEIINKFNSGEIDYTHMSDILRSELLYRYGGMWIDATYLVTQKICEKNFVDNKLHTIRYNKPIWDEDITHGRWSINYWIAPKHHKLFGFLTEAYWYYMETKGKIEEYFLTDYLVNLAIELMPDIEEEFLQNEPCAQNIINDAKKINMPCDDEEYLLFKQRAPLYKLNRRNEYQEYNIVGKKTIYGYLKEEILGNE